VCAGWWLRSDESRRVRPSALGVRVQIRSALHCCPLHLPQPLSCGPTVGFKTDVEVLCVCVCVCEWRGKRMTGG
jgi:hypothetical protein